MEARWRAFQQAVTPAPAATSAAHDDVAALQGLGFSEGDVRQALQAANGNRELAADILLNTQHAPSSSVPPATSPARPAPAPPVAESAAAALLGTAVEICCLRERPELNAAQGTAETFDASSGRYTVRLHHSGERVAVRPANLVPADAANVRRTRATCPSGP